jgi:hypothetical protein
MDTAASALVITAAMLFSLCLAVLVDEFVTGALFRFVFHRRPGAAQVEADANGGASACFGADNRFN